MKKMQFRCLAIASATILATTLALAAHQQEGQVDARTRRINLAVEQLKTVEYLVGAGKYTEAEAVAQASIDEIDSAGGNSRVAHVALGKALLFEGRYDDASLEVGWGWKPGRNRTQDLLFAVAGSWSQVEYRRTLAYSGLLSYVLRYKKVVADRLGDLAFDHYDMSSQTVSGTAALLYGADPTNPPEEALRFLAIADRHLPQSPYVAYVRGLTYLRLSKKPEAKRDLQFAADHGKPKLAEMARSRLEKIAGS